MVSIGINDARHSSRTMGVTSGSAKDIVKQSAEAVLTRIDLGLVLPLITLLRRTLSLIKQMLFGHFSTILSLSLSVFGKVHLIISAAFMAVGSVIVVGNSLMLYKVE